MRSARLLNIEIEERGRMRNRPAQPRHAAHREQSPPPRARLRPGPGAMDESPPTIADKALAMLEIDQNGLDEMDKRILEAIIVKFGGGPVGVSSLAVAVGEEPDTLEEVYEPYLIMEGYLNRTSQGRVVTELCYKRFRLAAPNRAATQPLLILLLFPRNGCFQLFPKLNKERWPVFNFLVFGIHVDFLSFGLGGLQVFKQIVGSNVCMHERSLPIACSESRQHVHAHEFSEGIIVLIGVFHAEEMG